MMNAMIKWAQIVNWFPADFLNWERIKFQYSNIAFFRLLCVVRSELCIAARLIRSEKRNISIERNDIGLICSVFYRRPSRSTLFVSWGHKLSSVKVKKALNMST